MARAAQGERSMKNSFVFLFCCSIVLAAHADVGARHFDKSGGFSLQAPKGWQFREFPGMKYQIVLGPASNSFSPNINVVDEAYGGSLKSYVDANKSTLDKMSIQLTLIKRDPFVTTSGIKGERMAITSLQQKNLLRQTFYFLPGAKGKYFVVSCSALAAGGEALDSVFEESIKTFEIIKVMKSP
jgi:hypothetical protein